MVLPAVLIIVVIAFFPVLYGVVLSFTDSTVTSFGSFVGLENYVEMFQDPDFLVGLPHGHLGGHVAPDVPARDRDFPVLGRDHRYHQRAGTLRPDAPADRGHPDRRVEDDAVYGALAPCWPPGDSRRGLRSSEGGRR